MKRIIVLLVLALIGLTLAAQSINRKKIGETFAKTLIEHVEGSIIFERDVPENTVMTYIVEVPDFYDKQYYMSSIYSLVSSFTDIYFLSVWKKDIDGNYEATLFIEPENYPSVAFMLRFEPNTSQLSIGYFYGEDPKNI